MADAADADVHFVCVGTPQRRDGLAADLTYLEAAVDALAPSCWNGPASSSASRPSRSEPPSGSPPGSPRSRPAGAGAELAWNPEFLREGFAVEDTLHPDRLVFGVRSRRRGADAAEARSTPGDRRRTSRWSSPTSRPPSWSRSSANAFLATKISFINAMAEICEVTGADVTKLADAIGHDPRIGRRFLNAGVGFGGGCLPKDIRAFMARAGEIGAGQALAFLAEVDAINLRRRERVAEIARELMGGVVAGKRVAVLGAAFKPDSDDVRDSPALTVAGQLQLQGAHVTVHDPKAIGQRSAAVSDADLRGLGDRTRAAMPTSCCTSPNGRSSARSTPKCSARSSRREMSSTAATASTATAWRAAGWTYRGLGRP